MNPEFMAISECHFLFVPIELLSPPDLPRFAARRFDMMY